MTPAEAGRFRLSPHAQERIRERNVRYLDVRQALVNAKACTAAKAEASPRGRVEGPDLDGDELVLVCVLEGGVVVVTVF